MKKTLLTLAVIAIAQFSYAQFSSSGGNTTTTDNVGIGTTSPGLQLDVELTNSATNTPSNVMRIGHISSGTPSAGFGTGLLFSGHSWFPGSTGLVDYAQINMVQATYNTARLDFNTLYGYGTFVTAMSLYNGNVGIGTTSPSAKLEVLGSIRNSSLLVKGAQPGIDLTNTSTSAHSWNIWSVGPSETWANGSLAFYDETANQYRFGIDNNGNVGIGTTSPTYKLEVNGAGSFSTTAFGNSAITVTHGNNSGALSGGYAGKFISRSDNGGGSQSGYGVYVSSPYDGSNASGNTYSLYKYGLYVDDLYSYYGVNTTTNNTNYGLFIKGGGQNYIAGNVGIGTTDPHGYKLAVNGSAIATSMTVKLYADWPDYVFKSTYHLPSLTTVKAYIDQNQHLPEMPSEQEVSKNGINLGEMNKLLVKKVEELTLYQIEQQENIKQQDNRIASLEAAVAKLTSTSSK